MVERYAKRKEMGSKVDQWEGQIIQAVGLDGGKKGPWVSLKGFGETKVWGFKFPRNWRDWPRKGFIREGNWPNF